MLLFHVGLENYALETHSVVEIIHRVELNKVHGMSAVMAGRFNYHGQLVPVLDMSQLLGGRPSRLALGTRIVLVQPASAEQGECPYEPPYELPSEAQLFGLLVEQVTETLDGSQCTQAAKSIDETQSPYFGKTLLYQQKMIQCLHTDKLFAQLGYNALENAALKLH